MPDTPVRVVPVRAGVAPGGRADRPAVHRLGSAIEDTRASRYASNEERGRLRLAARREPVP
jgi:hypothetical protein